MNRFKLAHDQQGVAYIKDFDDALYSEEEQRFVDELLELLDKMPGYLYSNREKILIIAALLEGELADYALFAVDPLEKELGGWEETGEENVL